MNASAGLFPDAQSNDSDDVRWALETGAAMWNRGDKRDALRWLKRAAESASDTGDDMRALTLAKTAAELRAKLDIPATVPPPAPDTEEAAAVNESVAAIASTPAAASAPAPAAPPAPPAPPAGSSPVAAPPPPPRGSVAPAAKPADDASRWKPMRRTSKPEPPPDQITEQLPMPADQPDARKTRPDDPPTDEVESGAPASHQPKPAYPGEITPQVDDDMPTRQFMRTELGLSPESKTFTDEAPSGAGSGPKAAPEPADTEVKLPALLGHQSVRVAVLAPPDDQGEFKVRLLRAGDALSTGTREAILVVLEPGMRPFE